MSDVVIQKRLITRDLFWFTFSNKPMFPISMRLLESGAKISGSHPLAIYSQILSFKITNQSCSQKLI